MLQWTLVHRYLYLFEFLLSILLGICLEVDLLNHMIIICLTFWETAKTLSTTFSPFKIPTTMKKFPIFHVLADACYFPFFFFNLNNSHPVVCGVRAHCDSGLHFPNDSWCWASFHMFIGCCRSFLEKSPFKFFAHLGIKLFVFCCWLGILYVFWILISYQICKYKYFLPSWKWKSHSQVRLFATPRTIQSMEFSRPEYWSGEPFPSPGDLPNPGIEPGSPALQGILYQLSLSFYSQWCLLMHKRFKFWWSLFYLFFFCCLCFWCHIQEIIFRFQVTKVFSYVSF